VQCNVWGQWVRTFLAGFVYDNDPFKFQKTAPFFKFRVCQSVHHHTFNWINQPDAATSQIYYLSFKYSSTCFGHPYAHHQELNKCSSSLWFYRWSVVVAVLLVVVGPARPRTTALLSPRFEGKTRGCYCSCWAPDDGRQDARNILSCK